VAGTAIFWEAEKRRMLATSAIRKVADRIGPHRPTPAYFCNADGDGRLVDVHADE